MKNPHFTDAQSAYYNQAKEFLIQLVPEGRNVVLDLGCGAGRLGQQLLEKKKASELVGVEIFEPAARKAMKWYKKVHIGDIEEMDLGYRDCFDVVICGDVLEHLRDPMTTIHRIRLWLKDGGTLVCSVPNVRYWRVLRDLALRGVWEYKAEGILDETHLRFFTSKSLEKMLANARLTTEWKGMRIAVGPRQRAFNRLTFGLLKEFLGFQILFLAKKLRT